MQAYTSHDVYEIIACGKAEQFSSELIFSMFHRIKFFQRNFVKKRMPKTGIFLT